MRLLKRIIKSIIISFSIYSKIPMPSFEWKEEDMKYHLWSFPLVGLLIGLVEIGWTYIAGVFDIGKMALCGVQIIIPIVITGGLHLDGFMDTMDAKSSYKDREEKLRILSDPHCGAFAVISMAVYMILYAAAVSEINNMSMIICLGLCFILSRSCCGLIILTIPNAKNKGMLADETANANTRIIKPILYVELILSLGAMLFLALIPAIILMVGQLLFFMLYKRMIMREFGGISGDLAGYYVSVYELISAIIISVCCIAGI